VFFYYQNLGGGMAENESYNSSVERTLESIHKDIRIIVEHVARQNFINESYKDAIQKHSKDIEELSQKVSALENKMSRLDGGLNIIRTAIVLLSGVIIGISGWVGSSIIKSTSDISLIKEKQTRLDADVTLMRNYQK